MTDDQERHHIACQAAALDDPKLCRDIEDMTDAQDEASAIAEAAQIAMTYRNWRGEVAQRTIRPVALWFGKTDWHPDPGC